MTLLVRQCVDAIAWPCQDFKAEKPLNSDTIARTENDEPSASLQP